MDARSKVSGLGSPVDKLTPHFLAVQRPLVLKRFSWMRRWSLLAAVGIPFDQIDLVHCRTLRRSAAVVGSCKPTRSDYEQ
jgi:hypothetical protein